MPRAYRALRFAWLNLGTRVLTPSRRRAVVVGIDWTPTGIEATIEWDDGERAGFRQELLEPATDGLS